MRYRSPTDAGARKGGVLLAVLVVVVLLTLAAYQFSEFATAEYRPAETSAGASQALCRGDSGVHFAAAALATRDTLASTLQNNPFNNPAVFQDVVVRSDDNPYLQGRFSLIALPDPDHLTAGT